GFAASFAGGDCNDRNAQVFPSANEVPGNGIDEDCSGRDDVAIQPRPKAAETPKDARAWIEQKLPQKLNLVLITIDTLRFDLGYTGYARRISPHLDALAKRSVWFEKAYSLASYTAKSLAPMLIGKYSSETHRDWSHFNRFSDKD